MICMWPALNKQWFFICLSVFLYSILPSKLLLVCFLSHVWAGDNIKIRKIFSHPWRVLFTSKFILNHLIHYSKAAVISLSLLVLGLHFIFPLFSLMYNKSKKNIYTPDFMVFTNDLYWQNHEDYYCFASKTWCFSWILYDKFSLLSGVMCSLRI